VIQAHYRDHADQAESGKLAKMGLLSLMTLTSACEKGDNKLIIIVGCLSDAVESTLSVRTMPAADTSKNSRFQRRRLERVTPLRRAKRIAHNIAGIGIAV